MLKGQKGITLVALVVTIIVLIILAGISISLVLGNNGIVKKATQGRDNYQTAANEEQVMVDDFEKVVANTMYNQ
jgi:type II secretory pathway pseudopilin PulG